MTDLASPRRRFQFSLRTLIIVVTLCAVTAGILTGVGMPITVRHRSTDWEEVDQAVINLPTIFALAAEVLAILAAAIVWRTRLHAQRRLALEAVSFQSD